MILPDNPSGRTLARKTRGVLSPSGFLPPSHSRRGTLRNHIRQLHEECFANQKYLITGQATIKYFDFRDARPIDVEAFDLEFFCKIRLYPFRLATSGLFTGGSNYFSAINARKPKRLALRQSKWLTIANTRSQKNFPSPIS